MQNLLEELKNLLQTDERLVINGNLLKNKIIELSLQLDPTLIGKLLSNPNIKRHFFQEIGNIQIFDKIKFQKFVTNKSFLPDSYTSFKNKIGLTIEGEYITESKEVVLTYPYKDCILEGGQTNDDAKRSEIFWNETLSPDEIDRLLHPKVFTNIQLFNIEGQSKEISFNKNTHLLIKGNNLLTLHSLKKIYAGQVRFIYIDPPYNTGGGGNTFAYNNTFNHSTWLTFMKNRLEVAKEFLTKDGFIAIAIDHFELFYLGVLSDEIFGRENRVGVVTVVHKPEGRNQEKFFATSNEFMLVYANNKELANFQNILIDEEKKKEYNLIDDKGRYKLSNYLRGGGGDDNLRINKPHFFYPVYVNSDTLEISMEFKMGYEEILPITNRGQERTWKTKRETLIEKIKLEEIVAEKDEKGKINIFEKYREDKGQLIKTHWIDKRYNAINNGTKIVETILGSNEFSYPKSLYLVQDIINLCTKKDSIVMDFFAGSGTTGHAVLNLNDEDGGNRKFILCEQMDYSESVTKERLSRCIKSYKKGELLFMELAEYNQKFIEQVLNSDSDNDLIDIWKRINEIAFVSYKLDTDFNNKHLDEFIELKIEDKKNILMDILDKNIAYIPYSEIDDKHYEIDDKVKKFNRLFYSQK